MQLEIEALEKERINIFKNFIIINKIVISLYIFSLISAVLFIIFRNLVFIYLTFGFIFIALILGVISSHLYDKKKKEMTEPFKERLVKTLLNQRYKNVQYDPKGQININMFLPSNLIRRPDQVISDDYISGSFNQVKFISSDVRLKAYTGRVNKYGQKYLGDYFKGRLLILETNSFIKGNVKVVEIRKDSYLSNPKTFETIEVESMEFNYKFQVDTDDKEEAFKLLTHKKIENILKIEKMFGGAISFTFSKNLVFIAINSYVNHFEPKFKVPISLDSHNYYMKEIDMFKNIIELLT